MEYSDVPLVNILAVPKFEAWVTLRKLNAVGMGSSVGRT